jgi:hypothetical protein
MQNDFYSVTLVGGYGNGCEVFKPVDQVNFHWCFMQDGEAYQYTEIDYEQGTAVAEYRQP